MSFSKYSIFIKSAWLLIVLTTLGTHSAFATDNSINPKNEVPLSELPPQVCGIEYKRTTPSAITPDPVTERNGEKANIDINCTATIIGPRLILTAKHCLKGENGVESALICRGGVRIPFDMSKEAYDRRVNSHLGEPNDIGLIELKEDIGIPPVQLPSTKSEIEKQLQNPENCMQIGFGKFTLPGEVIERSGLVNGSTTHGLELTTVNQDERERHFHVLKDPLNNARVPISQVIENNLLNSQNFLTQLKTDVEKPYLFLHGKGVAVSPGDSGGPLLCRNLQGRWVHLGVLTTGYLGFSGVYINTWAQRKWLGQFLPKQGIKLDAYTDTELLSWKSSLANTSPCIAGTCKNALMEKHIQFVELILRMEQEIDLESRSLHSSHSEAQGLERAKHELRRFLEYGQALCNSK